MGSINIGSVCRYSSETPAFLVTEINGTMIHVLKESQMGVLYQGVYVDYSQHSLPQELSVEESIAFKDRLRGYLANASAIQQSVNMVL